MTWCTSTLLQTGKWKSKSIYPPIVSMKDRTREKERKRERERERERENTYTHWTDCTNLLSHGCSSTHQEAKWTLEVQQLDTSSPLFRNSVKPQPSVKCTHNKYLSSSHGHKHNGLDQTAFVLTNVVTVELLTLLLFLLLLTLLHSLIFASFYPSPYYCYYYILRNVTYIHDIKLFHLVLLHITHLWFLLILIPIH